MEKCVAAPTGNGSGNTAYRTEPELQAEESYRTALHSFVILLVRSERLVFLNLRLK